MGMLSVKPDLLRQGIGLALVQGAENFAIDEGCFSIQLELLQPKDWAHNVKVMLDNWYTKMGYQKGEVLNFSDYYPQLVPLLSCDCTFTAYTK